MITTIGPISSSRLTRETSKRLAGQRDTSIMNVEQRRHVANAGFGDLRQRAINDLAKIYSQDPRELRLHFSDTMAQMVRECSSLYGQLLFGERWVQTCLLIGGSIVAGSATPDSDIDIALLVPPDLELPAKVFRHHILRAFEDAGVTNTDCVVLPTDSLICSWPADLIDRDMALTAQYISGDRSLYNEFRDHATTAQPKLLQILVRHTLHRAMDMQWTDTTKPSKHQDGGQRDLLRIRRILEMLPPQDTPDSDRTAAWDSFYILSRPIQDLQTVLSWQKACGIPSDHRVLELASKANQTRASICQLYERTVGLAAQYLDPDRQAAFKRMVEIQERGEVLHDGEVSKIPSADRDVFLRAFALAIGRDPSSDSIWKAWDLGWIGFIGLLVNPRTPSCALDEMAHLPGYEWRNIRDQVLKHRNVADSTVEFLANSDLRFTRQRAQAKLQSGGARQHGGWRGARRSSDMERLSSPAYRFLVSDYAARVEAAQNVEPTCFYREAERQMLAAYDPNGAAIGVDVPLGAAHRLGLIHQTADVFVVDTEARVLLQERAADDPMFPRKFCPTAGGHSLTGEPPSRTAERELLEEVGVRVAANCELLPLHSTDMGVPLFYREWRNEKSCQISWQSGLHEAVSTLRLSGGSSACQDPHWPDVFARWRMFLAGEHPAGDLAFLNQEFAYFFALVTTPHMLESIAKSAATSTTLVIKRLAELPNIACDPKRTTDGLWCLAREGYLERLTHIVRGGSTKDSHR